MEKWGKVFTKTQGRKSREIEGKGVQKKSTIEMEGSAENANKYCMKSSLFYNLK